MSGTFAFIQARMSSTRFPGKVLAPLEGVPLIVFMARRAERAKLVDHVVILTSTDASDDPLADAATKAGFKVFRGELHDVLARFAAASRAHAATEIVRLTGDCPLIDPAIIDAVIMARRQAGADYSSNIDPPSFPDGFDVECCTREALERADRGATAQPEREHVTLWMRSNGSGLRRMNHRAIADFSHLRLTVDFPDDLEVVRKLVSGFETGVYFDLYDVLRGLDLRPELLTMNRHVRNEALATRDETSSE